MKRHWNRHIKINQYWILDQCLTVTFSVIGGLTLWWLTYNCQYSVLLVKKALWLSNNYGNTSSHTCTDFEIQSKIVLTILLTIHLDWLDVNTRVHRLRVILSLMGNQYVCMKGCMCVRSCFIMTTIIIWTTIGFKKKSIYFKPVMKLQARARIKASWWSRSESTNQSMRMWMY